MVFYDCLFVNGDVFVLYFVFWGMFLILFNESGVECFKAW